MHRLIYGLSKQNKMTAKSKGVSRCGANSGVLFLWSRIGSLFGMRTPRSVAKCMFTAPDVVELEKVACTSVMGATNR